MGKRARHNQVAKQWRGCPEIRSPRGERAGKMCLWNRLHSPGLYPITTSLQRQGSRAQHGHPCGHPSQPPFLRLKEGLIKGSATRPTPGQTWTACSSCLLLPTSSFWRLIPITKHWSCKDWSSFFFFCLVCSGPCCDGVSIKWKMTFKYEATLNQRCELSTKSSQTESWG